MSERTNRADGQDEPPDHRPASAPPGRFSGLALATLIRLATKELRETLRDRRTVVTLLLMPLLVYPLLSLAFQRFLILYFEPESPRLRIGFVSGDDVEPFFGALAQSELLRGQSRDEDRDGDDSSDDSSTSTGGGLFRREQPDDGDVDISTITEWDVTNDIKEDLRNGRFDVGVEMVRSGQSKKYKLIYHDANPNSLRSLRLVVDRLRMVNEEHGRRALARLGEAGYPAEFERESISSKSLGGVSLAIVLPLILVLMTITGAVYPAIDLTAGERERGTLEALLASPVSRIGLLAAKYIAVVVVAQLTAIMNLLAMTLTVIASGLAQYLFPGGQFSLVVILQILALLFLFAAFFSAVLLVLTSMARSFKEAQAYLIPIMLLSISPGLVSLVPNIDLSSWFYVPLLNMVLFSRDLIEGTADPLFGSLTVLTTIIYTVAAGTLAARLFGTDTVLYGGQGTWKDLFRRPAKPTDGPTVSAALGALAVLFPIFFLTSGLLSALRLSQGATLVVSALASVVLFAVFPVVVCAVFRIRFASTFPFRPHFFGMLIGLLWGATVWMFAHEVLVVSHKIGMVMLDAERFKAIEEMLAKWRMLPLWLVLVSQALAPAVCEEIFFRGMLFKGLQRDLSNRSAWIWSSLLFGAFHVVSGNALTLERFLPSTLLGFFLGGLRLRTGSLLPGIIMHATNNGLLLAAAYYRDELMNAGWGMDEREHLPGLWLGIAALVIISGIAAIRQLRGDRGRMTGSAE